ncbi:MAG: TetR family transcriptional regulator [Kineosporiaceae bacterium]|nr:TetR family transcriptional regulator [Kineosporiaceae bacterium]
MSTQDWLDQPCPGLRKNPQQSRSRARVLAVLAAAERLIVREGLDGLTIRALADEAGVPIGTVYQFFVDKAGVIDTLVHRHGLAMREMLATLDGSPDLPRRPWPALVDEVFSHQVRRLREDPAYVTIWVERQLSPTAQREDDHDVERLAELLCRLLVEQEPLADSPVLRGLCRVATQSADSLLHLAFRLDPGGDPATLHEALHMVHLYLADIVANPAHRTGSGRGSAQPLSRRNIPLAPE